MIRAGAILRSVADCTFASLPPAVRKRLNGVQVRLADLGHTPDGRKVRGMARDDGAVVLLDRQTVEEWSEGELENVLAHELAHCYRARTGIADADDQREESGACRLVKSWGFRSEKELKC